MQLQHIETCVSTIVVRLVGSVMQFSLQHQFFVSGVEQLGLKQRLLGPEQFETDNPDIHYEYERANLFIPRWYGLYGTYTNGAIQSDQIELFVPLLQFSHWHDSYRHCKPQTT